MRWLSSSSSSGGGGSGGVEKGLVDGCLGGTTRADQAGPLAGLYLRF